MSMLEDSRSGATDMACPQRKKRKKNKDKSALGKNGVDIHGNNVDVVVECNAMHVLEAEGLKLASIEEKNVARAVIDCCLKSKDDSVELREDIDVKANETVSQTQSPKAKKRKPKKTKTMKVCDPQGNILGTSMKSGLVGCMMDDSNKETMGISDGYAGQKLMGDLASKKENPATEEEIGFQNLGKDKEKKTDEKTEVNLDPLGAEVVSDIGSKRRKKKRNRKKNGESLATMDSESVECLLDHSNREAVENCDVECASKDLASKIEDSVTREKGVQNIESTKQNKKGQKRKKTDEITEVNLDPLGAEVVSEIGPKRRKKKGNRKKNGESSATMYSESVQCLLDHSNREAVENCDVECASKDLASKIEDSVTGEKGVENIESTKQNKKGQKAEVDQDHLGAEGVNNVEMQTKKKKKKSKKKKKDDVSISIKEEEQESGRVKLESSVLMHNNMARVASKETEDVRTCTCKGESTKKLLVFDLNGILADIAQGYTGQYVPDGKVSQRSVFRRPFVADFLDFCFERFDVAIWSSRRVGLDFMTELVMRNYARKLLFCFDQSICTATNFKTQERSTKPLFLKDLRRVWDHFGTCLTCGKRKYDVTNTLLVDDSPQKALCNPPHSGIFPLPYVYTDREDSGLGPDSEIRKYLERLAKAENVQKFVEENPFGQPAITETHESWHYYSKIIEEHK